MTNPNGNLPPKLQSIVEDFQLSESQEKLELLLQYAEEMPPPPAWLEGGSGEKEPVEECMTPVSMQADVQDGRMFFFIDVPRSSPTVRGLATIMLYGLDGLPLEEILKVPNDFFQDMGLDQVLTYQRLNGFSAILAHMKLLATKAIQSQI
jgi:cysteine desulfuration protein SufE